VKHLIRSALLLVFAVNSAFAASAQERKFLREGMSEGDVLMKVGKPDSESVVSGGGAMVVEKKWIYLPVPDDQQTMTTITIVDGKVTRVERKVSY
jgi:hypothetical protein